MHFLFCLSLVGVIIKLIDSLICYASEIHTEPDTLGRENEIDDEIVQGVKFMILHEP